jgi:hypothetical protein
MPACRNVSLTPAARPLWCSGTEPSANAVTDGLNRPVPTIATIEPGSATVQEESTSATVSIAMPTATSMSPTVTMALLETRSCMALVAPATKNMMMVDGR